MTTIEGFDWHNKIALLRTDLNVPLHADGSIADDTRLVAAVPTIQTILQRGGSVVVLSHLGRPPEGVFDAALSLVEVARALAAVLNVPVTFSTLNEASRPAAGEVLMLENTRFNVGEKTNDSALAQRYAALGDVFVMDAFASAHRAEASLAALAQCGLPSLAGVLLHTELAMLARVTSNIQRPLVGVFGGAKISTKLAVLQRMTMLCDTVLVGGGMANTLLLAQGKCVGVSLVQHDMMEQAAAVLAAGNVHLPQDAVVAGATRTLGCTLPINAITANDKILDIGSATSAAFATHIQTARTVLWNGPMGWFEQPPYDAGTNCLAQCVAMASAQSTYSLVGGADTIAAVRAAGVSKQMSYISTGGGALLEFLAGNDMPGLAAFI